MIRRTSIELAAWVCAAPFIAGFIYIGWLLWTHPVALVLLMSIVVLVALSLWTKHSPRFADRDEVQR